MNLRSALPFMLEHPNLIKEQQSLILLPNEPRVVELEKQEKLTQRFLIPALRDIERFFLDIRAQLDSTLRNKQPNKSGKPYPLGQCLEITQAVQRQLTLVDPSRLSEVSSRGYTALVAFQRHGGSIRQVWGDLRGEYFQNAFLAGTLYIDASNDTVVPTKPKVEILPLADARFVPISDYRHFSQIATRYWRAHVYPNHLIPALAPYFPLISLIPNNGIQLHNNSNYMLMLTRRNSFRLSEEVLNVPFGNDDLFQLIKESLHGSGLDVAKDGKQGHAIAIQYCRQYRAEDRQQSDEYCVAAIEGMHKANKYMAQLTVQAKYQNAA